MNSTGFYHGKTKDGHRFTLANNTTKTKDGKIKFLSSVSVCSDRDCFKKSFGRKVAEARLEKGVKVNVFTFDTHREFHDYMNNQTVAGLTQLFLNQSNN